MTVVAAAPIPRPLQRSGIERVPGADGLRGLAALAIVLHHSAFVAGVAPRPDYWGALTSRLDVGVPVFFALSGFLLFRPMVARIIAGRPEQSGAQGHSLWRFWRRRLLRIFPGYWAAFLIQLLIGAVSVLGATGFLVSFSLTHIYAGRRALSGITQSWSLGTELAFYLVLPLYAVVAGRLIRRRTPVQQILVLLGGCALWVLISVVTRIGALAANGWWETNWRYTVFANADYFAVGMACACLAVGSQISADFAALQQRMFRRPWLWYVGGAVAFFLTATQLGLPRDLKRADAQGEMARQLGYMLVAVGTVAPACLAGFRQRSSRALSVAPLVFLGAISYGLYLWHQIFLSAPKGVGLALQWFDWRLFEAPLVPVFLISATGGIILGALSWYLLEKPLLDRFR